MQNERIVKFIFVGERFYNVHGFYETLPIVDYDYNDPSEIYI